jgi:hypothetical protein
VKEAYYEDQLGEVIQNMIPQVHLLGEGYVCFTLIYCFFLIFITIGAKYLSDL